MQDQFARIAAMRFNPRPREGATCEVRPRFAYVENSPALTSRGLARVLADLASIGGDAQWCVAGADDQGAWHERKRLWLVADFDGAWEQQPQRLDRQIGGRAGNRVADVADDDSSGFKEQRQPKFVGPQHTAFESGDWWAAEPGVVRMVHGLANRVDRIAALGNGQVPVVAARAWDWLTQ